MLQSADEAGFSNSRATSPAAASAPPARSTATREPSSASRPFPAGRIFPLRAALARGARPPVVLENDGIAAANGEWKFGAGRGLSHLVYVTVSTGIGGGVVVDGKLMRGRRGMAGHVGHMMIDPNGPRCACGGKGCFEAHASGTALGEAARANRLRGRESRRRRRPRGRQRRARAVGPGSRLPRLRLRQPPASLQPGKTHHRRRRLAGAGSDGGADQGAAATSS